MYDQSELSTVRRLRGERDGDERPVVSVRRESDAHGLRQAEEPADGVNPQGVIWRWHTRRRRQR